MDAPCHMYKCTKARICSGLLAPLNSSFYPANMLQLLLLLLHNHGFQIGTLLVLRLDLGNDWAQVWFVLFWFGLFACWKELMC